MIELKKRWKAAGAACLFLLLALAVLPGLTRKQTEEKEERDPDAVSIWYPGGYEILSNMELNDVWAVEEMENRLDAANITCNKNAIPNDPQSPFVTSGVRLGTAAVTSRGMQPEDMETIAEAISLMLKDTANEAQAKALVKQLTDKYPLNA